MPSELLVIEQPKKRKNILSHVISLLIFALVVTSGYFYYQYHRLATGSVIDQVKAEEESVNLIASVSKLMLLPKDETPTVATVTDIEKLKDQPFFKDAKNGNKVLIYPSLKQVILYDQKSNMIVAVGSLNITDDTKPQELQAKVVLRNGTSVPGITQTLESTLKQSFPGVTISFKDQGDRTDYKNTVVVALTESGKDAATQIAKSIGSQVVELPEGESRPTGPDLLIIVGKDKT